MKYLLLLCALMLAFNCDDEEKNPCDNPKETGCGTECYDELGIYSGSYCWKDSTQQDSCSYTARYRICVRCLEECKASIDFVAVSDSLEDQAFYDWFFCVYNKEPKSFIDAMDVLFDTTKTLALKQSGFEPCIVCK